MTNQLYYGDNLQVLRDSIASESIDLIYLDPLTKSRVFHQRWSFLRNAASSPISIALSVHSLLKSLPPFPLFPLHLFYKFFPFLFLR
jgi:hypothetical protein